MKEKKTIQKVKKNQAYLIEMIMVRPKEEGGAIAKVWSIMMYIAHNCFLLSAPSSRITCKCYKYEGKIVTQQ